MDESLNQGTQELAAELTIAWLTNPSTRAQAADVRDFLQSMYEAVSALVTVPAESTASIEVTQDYKPATTARRSLSSQEHIISLIDGKPYKTLRRHLSGHGLTPEQYRQRYGLKADYPMVAPAYAEVRRAMAKKIGLGRKPRTDAPASEASAPAAKPSKPGRKPAADTE
jgi:predicted transcriptional regulator